jgi:putative sterol carrier protein
MQFIIQSISEEEARMTKTIQWVLAAASAVLAAPALAAPVMMSEEWGKDACAAWNKDPVLTDKLGESGWAKNDGGKGFKVMQVYRNDCKDSPKVELRIALKDGKAMCTYGGKVETAKLNSSHDYVMYAETTRWVEMGKGEYGPMRAMTFGRLKFDGPMGEAMGNMGPFENFLLLVGKVPSDTASCPK